MINSMTGYGHAEGEDNGVTYSIEIKSVNNRYLKTVTKLPDIVAFLEEDIEKLIRNNLSRGTVNYNLNLKNVSAKALFDIDEAALYTTIEKLNRLKFSNNINGTIDLASLLNLPGILRPIVPDKEKEKQMKNTILSVTKEAIEKLKRMRAEEGSFLETELKRNCKAIKDDLEQIRLLSTDTLKEYAKKLKKRVNQLLAEEKLKLDEETIAREVAIFADKSDISEEIARLDSHLQQFEQTCQTNDQAGRRLDFICQEMLREANTIASKASDTEIIRCVVDIKCRIDRIKEQIQNIE